MEERLGITQLKKGDFLKRRPDKTIYEIENIVTDEAAGKLPRKLYFFKGFTIPTGLMASMFETEGGFFIMYNEDGNRK